MATTTNRIRTAHDREQTEGKVTRATESLTGKIPSIAYFSAAVGSMAASATLHAMGKQKLSLFVGQWAPSLLVIGLYNKLVKVAGSD